MDIANLSIQDTNESNLPVCFIEVDRSFEYSLKRRDTVKFFLGDSLVFEALVCGKTFRMYEINPRLNTVGFKLNNITVLGYKISMTYALKLYANLQRKNREICPTYEKPEKKEPLKSSQKPKIDRGIVRAHRIMYELVRSRKYKAIFYKTISVFKRIFNKNLFKISDNIFRNLNKYHNNLSESSRENMIKELEIPP